MNANETIRPVDFCTPSATVRIGRVTVRKDWDARTYSVSAPGFEPRSTKNWSRMLDLVTGLA